MDVEQVARLRAVLEEIDVKLLSLLEGASPVDEALMHRIAMLELARSATLRLVLAAEGGEAPCQFAQPPR